MSFRVVSVPVDFVSLSHGLFNKSNWLFQCKPLDQWKRVASSVESILKFTRLFSCCCCGDTFVAHTVKHIFTLSVFVPSCLWSGGIWVRKVVNGRLPKRNNEQRERGRGQSCVTLFLSHVISCKYKWPVDTLWMVSNLNWIIHASTPLSPCHVDTLMPCYTETLFSSFLSFATSGRKKSLFRSSPPSSSGKWCRCSSDISLTDAVSCSFAKCTSSSRHLLLINCNLHSVALAPLDFDW